MSAVERKPQRRRVPLPEMERMDRVGIIRLGEMVPTSDGKSKRPSKLSYFRVDEDESGATSAAAAQAFHDVYGDRPTTIDVILAGLEPDDVLEGRWRLYGQSGLKLSCDGSTCDERQESGGWLEMPCKCKSLGVPEKHRNHCTLVHTLHVLLPRVRGIGVWQVSTGSEISVQSVASTLTMTRRLAGELFGLPFKLDLVETKVRPSGKPGTVYTLRLRQESLTPAQLMAGDVALEPGARRLLEQARGELPRPLDDDRADPLLVSGGVVEGVLDAPGAATPAEGAPHRDAPRVAPEPASGTEVTQEGGQSDVTPPQDPPASDRTTTAGTSATAPGQSESASEPEPLLRSVNRQVKDMVESGQSSHLTTWCQFHGVNPSSKALSEKFGEAARNLPALMAQFPMDVQT